MDGFLDFERKGQYRNLKVFKKAECIYDITYYFAHTYLKPYGDRTVDQMVQAARSGKQNIAEGMADELVSSKMAVKLVGVAKSSLHELLQDYEDYLRTRGLERWNGDNPKAVKCAQVCAAHNDTEFYMKQIPQRNETAICNIAITLIHQADAMLEGLLRRLQANFLENGGISEQMLQARLKSRGRR